LRFSVPRVLGEGHPAPLKFHKGAALVLPFQPCPRPLRPPPSPLPAATATLPSRALDSLSMEGKYSQFLGKSTQVLPMEVAGGCVEGFGEGDGCVVALYPSFPALEITSKRAGSLEERGSGIQLQWSSWEGPTGGADTPPP
ncbi:Sorbose reductase like SOU2, partial [Dissostichus eleginoides]